MAVLSGELLEREAELERLESMLAEARSGEGRVVVIEAPAGIGKTELLRAARSSGKRAGMRVLHARGGELEREFPFGLVRQLFEPLLAEAEEGEREELLSGAAGAVRPLLAEGRVMPALGDAYLPILNGLYWLTANLAEREPLLLAVDDAHWGDEGSLRYLDFLARRVEEIPVTLAVAARPAEPGADVRPVAQLAADPAAEVIRPKPLSEAAVTELVRSALGEDAAGEFCRACHEATGGNPFVLRDLLGELETEGIAPTAAEADRVTKLTPKTVSRAVLLRLSRLSQDAIRLARAVAVLGHDAELRNAAALAEVDRESASRAADALAEVEILAPGRPLAFVHPLIRSAVYEDLPAGDRSSMHEAAARLLAEQNADPDQVGVQLLATDPAGDPAVVELLLTAAGRAIERGAAQGAVAYLRRAWAEAPQGEGKRAVLRELATAVSRTGDPPTMEEFHEMLIRELTSEPDLLTECASELAFGLYRMGSSDDASALLARAIEAAKAAGDDDQAFFLEVHRVQSDQIPPAEAKARLEPYRERIQPGSATDRLWEGVEAYLMMLIGENAAGAAELARRGLEGLQLFIDQPGSPAWTLMVTVLLWAEDFDSAEPAIDVMIGGARAIGSTTFVGLSSGYRSELAYWRGQIADAEADARSAAEIGQMREFAEFLSGLLSWLLDVLVERDEVDEAERELEAAEMATDVPDRFWNLPVLASRAQIKLARGRHQEALNELSELIRRAERDGISPQTAYSEAAVIQAGLGNHIEAMRLAELGLETAHTWGTSGRIGNALRSLGLVVGAEEGLEHLHQAVATLEPSQAGLEYMRALVDLGAALRRANRREEAREPLRKALDLARQGGAIRLAARAHEELQATGEKLRPLTPTGPESLTPSERRITQLAAGGMTNKQIAQDLFLTVKTIEMHLSHAYRKLDISSRAELPEALA